MMLAMLYTLLSVTAADSHVLLFMNMEESLEVAEVSATGRVTYLFELHMSYTGRIEYGVEILSGPDSLEGTLITGSQMTLPETLSHHSTGHLTGHEVEVAQGDTVLVLLGLDPSGVQQGYQVIRIEPAPDLVETGNLPDQL